MSQLSGHHGYRESVTAWLAAHQSYEEKLQAELDTSPGEPEKVGALTVAACGALSAAVALAWVGRWMGDAKADELAGLMRHYTSNGGDDYTLFNDDFDGVAPGEAASKDGSWEPDWTIRPGFHLQEWLVENDVTVRQFTQRSQLDYRDVQGVLDGSRRINKQIATGLNRVTGITENFWLRAETKYRRDLAHGRIDATDRPE
jgi:plasmid maintenance system antidote protein VapI